MSCQDDTHSMTIMSPAELSDDNAELSGQDDTHDLTIISPIDPRRSP